MNDGRGQTTDDLGNEGENLVNISRRPNSDAENHVNSSSDTTMSDVPSQPRDSPRIAKPRYNRESTRKTRGSCVVLGREDRLRGMQKQREEPLTWGDNLWSARLAMPPSSDIIRRIQNISD